MKNIEILKSSLMVILGLNKTFKTELWSLLVYEPYTISQLLVFSISELVKNIEIVISSLFVTSAGNDQIGIYK